MEYREELRIRDDENNHLAQMAKSQGFKILQKMAKDLEEMSLKSALSQGSSDEKLIKLGEISGIRKLLALVVSRSESENITPSWTEKQGVPAWQTKQE